MLSQEARFLWSLIEDPSLIWSAARGISYLRIPLALCDLSLKDYIPVRLAGQVLQSCPMSPVQQNITFLQVIYPHLTIRSNEYKLRDGTSIFESGSLDPYVWSNWGPN